MAKCNQLTPLPFKGLNNGFTADFSHERYKLHLHIQLAQSEVQRTSASAEQ